MFISRDQSIGEERSCRCRSNRRERRLRLAAEFAIPTKVAGADVTDNDDGTRFALNSYRARDGVMVSELHGSFESTARAEYYFDKNLSKAVRVEHRGIKRDRKGKPVGKRAQIISQVISRVDPPESREVPAILWTSGTDFYELTSDSLPHILSLEKDLTP